MEGDQQLKTGHTALRLFLRTDIWRATRDFIATDDKCGGRRRRPLRVEGGSAVRTPTPVIFRRCNSKATKNRPCIPHAHARAFSLESHVSDMCLRIALSSLPHLNAPAWRAPLT